MAKRDAAARRAMSALGEGMAEEASRLIARD